MIDKAFGIEDKQKYFPHSRWLLNYGRDKEKNPLMPDTIMIYNGKFYVLDAKYYRYGVSGNSEHLPNSSDINKQITYGEYIAQHSQIPNEKLFNAFLLPYNMNNNPFGLKLTFGNFGEAVGDWKENIHYYERVRAGTRDSC